VISKIADREWHKVLHLDGVVRFRELKLNDDPAYSSPRSGRLRPRYGRARSSARMERELLAPLRGGRWNRHAGDTPLAVWKLAVRPTLFRECETASEGAKVNVVARTKTASAEDREAKRRT